MAGDDAKGGTAGTNLLFLREEDIRLAQDLILLGYRDLTGTTDAVLAARGLGRAHHRALHFIGRNPGLTVGDLLGLLGVTKQSLARVLGPLLAQGLVSQTASRVDRRQRLLLLTPAGADLPAGRRNGGGGLPAGDAAAAGRQGARLCRQARSVSVLTKAREAARFGYCVVQGRDSIRVMA
jgi:DNA-binding MarR family transcriptional regulator